MEFQVASGLESCTTPIEVEVVKAADGSGDVTLETSKRDATVTINGVTPTLDAVALSTSAVTVDGSTAVDEISATATSAKGTDITGNVAWSVSPADKGVTINATTGKIAVTPKAAQTAYTITATPNGTSAQGEAKTATLAVTRAAPVVQSIAIYQGDTVVGENATIIIPTTDEPNIYTYTVKSTDQYDDVAVVGAPDWTFATADAYVTFTNGVVSVAKGAVKDTPYTLTAKVGEKTATTTLTAKDIEIDWPEVTDNAVTGTYGQAWKDIVTLTGGSASVAGTAVPGTFTLKDPDVKPNVADTQYTVVFDSTDKAYHVEQAFSATINPKALTADMVSPIDNVTYTGNALEPEVTVTDGDLIKAEDYTLSYVNNTNAGEATVTITGQNNYTGTVEKKFTIDKAAVTLNPLNEIAPIYANDTNNENATGLLDCIEFEFPTVSGTFGESGTPVTFGADWAMTAGTWDAKGGEYTFTATLEGTDNYTVTAPVVNFKVIPVTATQKIDPSAMSVKKATVADAADLQTLGLPTSVSVTYAPAEANAEAASYAISGWDKTLDALKTTAAGVSDEGSADVVMTPDYSDVPDWATLAAAPTFTLTITGKDPATVNVTGISDVTFGDELGTPSATAVDKDNNTVAGTFTYSYAGVGDTTYGPSETAPVNAGTYKVTATLVSDSYMGKGDLNFTIAPKTIIADMVSGTDAVVYNGSAQEPVVVTGLVKDTDYTVEYTNNINAGEATATITGIGNYGGTVTVKFTITSKPITADMIPDVADVVYNGSAQEPVVVTGLVKGTDYTISYVNNTDVGTATATIKGIGNYSGELTKTFTIKAAPVSGIVSITNNATDTIKSGTELTANTSKVLPAGATLTYQWNKDGTAITGANEATYTVKEGDEGTITVTVSGTGNYSGTVTSSPVVVNKIPVSNVVTNFVLIAEKDTSGKITLTATVTFDGMTTDEFNANFYIQWLRDGVEFGGKVKLGNARATDGVVSYEVVPEDAGSVITCEIRTEETSTTHTGVYSVKGDAKDLGDGGVLDSNGDFTVPANTVPAAPGNVAATVSSRSVTVTWAAVPEKDNGGKPVTAYHVTLTPASGTAITADITDGQLTHTFTNVPNGTYVVTVTAENEIGISAAGTAEKTITVNVSSGGGGGGGGGSSWGSSTNNVTVSSTSHGSVSVSPRNPSKGSKVTLTVKPHTGYTLDSLNVQISSSGVNVDLNKVSDTEYTFTMPSGKVKVNATFVKDDGKQDEPTDTPTGFPFTDAEDSWARDAIAWAYEKGYVNGTSATTFNPNGNITRQQMWMILARLSGQSPYNMTEARQWAMDNGVSDGTNATNPMTRQQMVTFLYRYAQLKGYELTGATSLDSYPDSATVSGYAQTPLAWAVGNAIVNGTSNGTLNPGGTATRAQFATILQRFYNGVVGE